MTEIPNLAIAQIAANQNQKEVTANEAFDRLHLALAGALEVDPATDGVPLTSAESHHDIVFRCVGAIPGRQLQAPQLKRLFIVVNTGPGHAFEMARGRDPDRGRARARLRPLR